MRITLLLPVIAMLALAPASFALVEPPTTGVAEQDVSLTPLRTAIADALRDGSLSANDVSYALTTIGQIEQQIERSDFAKAATLATELSRNANFARFTPALNALAEVLSQKQDAAGAPIIEAANRSIERYLKLVALPGADEMRDLETDVRQAMEQISQRSGGAARSRQQTIEKLSTVLQELQALRQVAEAREQRDLVREVTAIQSVAAMPNLRAGSNRALLRSELRTSEAKVSALIDEVCKSIVDELPMWPDATRIEELSEPLRAFTGAYVSQELREKLDRVTHAATIWAGTAKFEKQGRFNAAIAYLQSGPFHQGTRDGPDEHPLFGEAVMTARIADLRMKARERGDSFADPRMKPVVASIDAALEPWVSADSNRNSRIFNGEGEPMLAELADLRQQLAPMRVAVDALSRKDLAHFREVFDRVKRSRAKISHRWVDKVARLWRGVVGQYLNATGVLGDQKLEANADAGGQFLAAARARVDAGEYQRAVEILNVWKYALPDPAHSDAVASDLTALNLFIQASNLDKAGDELEAGRRYRIVLTYTSPRVPAKAAGERLAELAKTHPQLLAEPLPIVAPGSRSRAPAAEPSNDD